MRLFKSTILVSILLFVLVSFFDSPTAKAIGYGGLGIYPNESEVDKNNPLTRAWFIYALEPSETKEGKVDVANNLGEPLEIKIYPVDALTTKDGAFAPKAEDSKGVDVGAWITLAESEISLGPYETKTIDFSVEVPENAEVGDHMGAIIVQGKKPPELEGSGLRITTRVGVRMYITVPGDIVRELEFNDFTWNIQDGKVAFYLTFTNKGNIRIVPKGEIKIRDAAGKEIGSIKIPEREVFPKSTITVPVEWTETPASGKFIAVASVTYGADGILTRTIKFALGGGEASKITTMLASIFASRWLPFGAGLGFGIFMTLLIVLFMIVRKKVGKKKRKKIK